MQDSKPLVVVTGAAGALGRTVAAAFASRGARVLRVDMAGVDLPPLESTLDLAVDLTDAAATAAAFEPLLLTHGPATVLCNIAGGFTMGDPVHAVADQTWRRLIDLNVSTLINASRAVVPGMISARRGGIVNVAAASAHSGKAEMGAYCASKSAVARLTESMAMELREHGINVNAVAPSIIDSAANRTAMPDADFSRWVTPEALTEVIFFLASDAARAVHGAIVPVIGLS